MISRTNDRSDAEAMLAVLVEAALAAGRIVMEAFGGTGGYETKADASPVTQADRQAEAIIAAHLAAAFPDIPLVAEEAISNGHVPAALGTRFFLVDPLDGTREFIAGIGDFTVNIALVEDGRPRIGVVLAPAYGELFTGSPAGAVKAVLGPDGSARPGRAIAVRARPDAPLVLVSRSRAVTREVDAFLRRHPCAEVVPVGSSLKFCRIAEGAADLYPGFGRTMEWDTAAGQAVLEAAGGAVTRADGGAFTYAKRGRADDVDFANPHFLALGGALAQSGPL